MTTDGDELAPPLPEVPRRPIPCRDMTVVEGYDDARTPPTRRDDRPSPVPRSH